MSQAWDPQVADYAPQREVFRDEVRKRAAYPLNDDGLAYSQTAEASVQNRTVCLVSSACRLRVSAEAMLRARPAAAFAPLNHILISGFFFNQGFFIACSLSKHSAVREVTILEFPRFV